MTATVLNALIEAERRRESVALVTVTEGEGTYAELPGRHLVVVRPPLRAAAVLTVRRVRRVRSVRC